VRIVTEFSETLTKKGEKVKITTNLAYLLGVIGGDGTIQKLLPK
jgi:NAD kinase